MPRRVRPYGSAEDAESAALARGRLHGGGPGGAPAGAVTLREAARDAAEATRELREVTRDGAGLAGADDVREVLASLERMVKDLPALCEQLARILVVQREEAQAAPGSGAAPGLWVVEAVQALAAAGQAADMLTAALAQAGQTSAELGQRR